MASMGSKASKVLKAGFERAKHYGEYVKEPWSILATAIAWLSAKLDSKKQEKSLEEIKENIEELKKKQEQREDHHMGLVAGELNEEVPNLVVAAEEWYEEVPNLVVAAEEWYEEEDTPEPWENPFI